MPTTPAATPEEVDDQPWASPMAGESSAWFQRFSLYAAMGAARSVRAVYNAELAQRNTDQSQAATVQGQRSRAVPSSWSKASHRFRWQQRAESFDAWRRKEVFATGNASDLARIKMLDALIDKLCERIMALLDLPIDEITSFNPDAIARLATQLLAAIDLMAKHTGGYSPQRVEHTGKDGKAIEIEETKLNVVFYMPDVDALEDIVGAEVLASNDEQGGEQ